MKRHTERQGDKHLDSFNALCGVNLFCKILPFHCSISKLSIKVTPHPPQSHRTHPPPTKMQNWGGINLRIFSRTIEPKEIKFT
jgi:hypothetical protein